MTFMRKLNAPQATIVILPSFSQA